MEFINYREGECIKFTSPTNASSFKLGVIIEGTENNITVALLNITGTVIDRLFNMQILEETQETVTVAKTSIIKNVLVLSEKYFDNRKMDPIDYFEGMTDIYAVSNSSRSSFSLPSA